MRSATRVLFTSAMLAVANAQGVIVKAVGDSGTSTGLQVDPKNPADANFISAAELSANVVNECGRTMAGGNIDIGENTETALAAKQVTQVTKGSTVTMTINTVNATGQGPFTCDLDPTSNALGTSGQTPLTVQGNAQGNGMQQIKVSLPKDMACTGSSQGNVCTVRCKNANDFGGCIAVQQTDTKALPADNSPSNIKSAQTLQGIMAQIAQNKQDLAAAIQGNENAGSVPEQGPDIAQAILDSDPAITQATNKEVSQQVKQGAVTGAANNGNANANTGNANANTGNANANTGKGKGGNKGGANAGNNAGGAATGATTGAATGGNGRGGNGRGQGATAGGGNANNAATGGAATAATGGNGNGGNGGGRAGGLASLFGGGKNNNNKRMASSERRAKRYIDVGKDFQIGGN